MKKLGRPRTARVLLPDGRTPLVKDYAVEIGVTAQAVYRHLTWDKAHKRWRLRPEGGSLVQCITPDGTRMPMIRYAETCGVTREALYQRATWDSDAQAWRVRAPKFRRRSAEAA